jgi:hypothetical protein
VAVTLTFQRIRHLTGTDGNGVPFSIPQPYGEPKVRTATLHGEPGDTDTEKLRANFSAWYGYPSLFEVTMVATRNGVSSTLVKRLQPTRNGTDRCKLPS